MNLPMPSQLITPRESFPTLVARITLLPLVRPHVLAQIGAFREGRGAAWVGTVEGFGAGVRSCARVWVAVLVREGQRKREGGGGGRTEVNR